MDGNLLIQIALVLVSGGAIYGALKADLRNMHQRIDDERRLREQHDARDDMTHHDIRGQLQEQVSRIARIEGQNDLGEKILSALRNHN